MDHMITMMEKYQTHLEELVDERTEELNEEKKRTETLLHRMLPKFEEFPFNSYIKGLLIMNTCF